MDSRTNEQQLHPPVVPTTLTQWRPESIPSTSQDQAFQNGSLRNPDLLDELDILRLEVSRRLEQSQRAEFGQFLTPAPVAELMASMLPVSGPVVSLLDAGAGIGSLLAAAVAHYCAQAQRPDAVHITAYEIDPLLVVYLRQTLELCAATCKQAGVKFSAEVRAIDFIRDVAGFNSQTLFASPFQAFTAAILNPPYRKINARSETRQLLREMGIETSNLYTGFLATAVRLLAPGADMVTITPRSFCNGTYFRGFRESFLSDMTIRRIHLFDSRQEAFRDDAILQETIILHSVKRSVERSVKRNTEGQAVPEPVTITSSAGADEQSVLTRLLPYSKVVHPDDPERFIRVVTDGISQQVVDRMDRFRITLDDLGLTVSTGRVVDFRARDYLQVLRQQPEAAPLIYPVNLEGGGIAWPKQTKKAQYIGVCKETETLLIPNETYTLVKRFSSKEQNRRIVAAVFEGGQLPGSSVGVENHLNYFHRRGRGIGLALARGLSLYLNSTLVDAYFRQFNGHTQVNATDLRSLKYPTLPELEALGEAVQGQLSAQGQLTQGQAINKQLTQEQIDCMIDKEFFPMTDALTGDPVAATKHLQEALEVLKLLGLPKAQINERSALTLLALLDLTPERQWSQASQPMLGITPMMDFMDQSYGKKYAPNSRETVRRQTVHQFLDAGLIVANPDDPKRPINSGKNVYQIESSALEMLRTYGTPQWDKNLNAYLASVETLIKRYAQERQMARIPVQIAPGKTITLSPGGQNVLVEQIIHEFASRYTPSAEMIYVGDTDDKFAYFDEAALTALGVTMNSHGKMPDVIIHYTDKNWLILIEAVTSHGPINPKRQAELKRLFSHSTAGLVLVTAFLSRKSMLEYFPEISWETEVWLAEEPDHLLHFNGERFLGPY